MTPALGLFIAACFGHFALLMRSHNWWYGLALPRKAGDVVHLVHAGLFILGPLLAWRFVGFDLSDLFTAASGPWRFVPAAYVALCWVAAFVFMPAVTFWRNFRPAPSALLESRSQIFDVAEQLGHKPAGTGFDRSLALLPGNDVFRVEFVERTLRLPRLPAAWDGLTILHLSDLHLKGTPDRDFFRAVMDRCTALKPDLVAVTGDIVDSVFHQKWIIPILGRLRWKIAGLAILGNHDYWYDPPFIRRRLARLGMNYLGNGWQQIEVRGEPLVAIGNEVPWGQPAPDLTGCPDGPFRLLLSHTPDNIEWARRAKVDLMLAGHVHGGQIRVPGIGSILVPSRYGRRYDQGLFDRPPTLLNVTRGLSGEHPLRYFCVPEVILLTLRRPV